MNLFMKACLSLFEFFYHRNGGANCALVGPRKIPITTMSMQPCQQQLNLTCFFTSLVPARQQKKGTSASKKTVHCWFFHDECIWVWRKDSISYDTLACLWRRACLLITLSVLIVFLQGCVVAQNLFIPFKYNYNVFSILKAFFSSVTRTNLWGWQFKKFHRISFKELDMINCEFGHTR